MNQLTQQLKSGKMQLLEVPIPTLGPNQVMLKNLYSVISAGTEGKTVSDARKGYIAKARSRQKEVKMVIDMIKNQGIIDTYKLVMNKLEAASPLGYSCAGEVIKVGENITDIKVGDHVACGGNGAFHAEIVTVERNLCVVVPKNVDIEEASFATIAAIAMQGVRQADCNLGESVAVIGLGLIGQLTIQFLNVSGVKTIGIDVNPAQVKIAKENGVCLGLTRSQDGLEHIINEYTGGHGVDAVIITAGTSSLDPVELSGRIARKKGKVIVVGAVPTGFSRAEYYKKELDLRMSSSYGPGRYDVNYETKGVDYPYAYVRWTENRNMMAYIDLLSSKSIKIRPLISHSFDFEHASDAYQMIYDKSEPFIGITIKYDERKSVSTEKIIVNSDMFISEDNVNLAFIGAGNFAQNSLLPRLKNNSAVNFIGVMSGHGNTSKYVADKYKFKYCTHDANQILKDKNVNTVFVCTRHNLHAKYVLDALKSSKNVYVEKPLAMNMEELDAIKDAYFSSPKPLHLMVGYNRRFSPAVKEIKKLFLQDQAKAINIRVNAGIVPKDHWVHDRNIGGGRIIGEACHFIDLAMFIAGSKIDCITVCKLQNANNLNDTVVISMTFTNGSIANISYFSNGNKHLPKELIEVFCDETTAVIDDFTKLIIYGKSKKEFKYKQDKGHTNELIEYVQSIKDGRSTPISFDELYDVMAATIKVVNQL